jgi:ribosomal protein L22
MADLENIEIKSITDMSPDEAIEYLRQIRLSRRVPDKKRSASSKAKTKQSVAASKITKQDAETLLKLLGA